jgi:glutathione peroxidase
MKTIAHLSMLALLALPMASQAAESCPELLNHEFKRLPSGKTENLCQYRGKVVLVVNTASRCGFTPQFDGLQKIYEQYKGKGLVVLGFPSNDFNQELAEGQKIAEFCKLNYGVDFPMYEKSGVKGPNASAFYKALAKSSGTEPQWNFHKYLITRDGKTVVPLHSRVEPESREMRTKIEAMLEQKG